MKMKAREALDAYYEQAGSWGQDRQESLQRSRRVAWIVAAVAALVAVLEAIALTTLIPLKTVQPYTLLVDRQTGFVQALNPLERPTIAGDAALTQSFLVQYVIAREGFDFATVQANYRKAYLFSAGTARSDYVAAMQASNPESPLNRLDRQSSLDVRVKSVSPLGGNRALVRFDTLRKRAGVQSTVQPWVVVIEYRYSGEPLKLEDRFVNPLGFEVIRYQRNIEALPPAEPTQQPGSPVPPGQTGPSGAATGGGPGAVPSPAPAPTPQSPDQRSDAVRRLPNGDILTL